MLWYKMSVGSGGPPRPVLRMHAGMPDRDRGGARGPHPPGSGRGRDRPVTQGLTRAQLGVTDEMVAAYGDTIFALSNNLQTRRGDPVREKDFAAIEAHRHELGMGDAGIAERIGLTPAQVTLIRNLEERRRFRTGHYHVLNALGGGRRYREERFVPFQDHFRFSEEALSLRAAFSLDPERVRAYVDGGWWRSDTLSDWLRRNAQERPDGSALVDARGTVSNDELEARVASIARGLHHAGVRPGDVVAVQLPNIREHIEVLLAVSALGAVTTTLYMSFRGLGDRGAAPALEGPDDGRAGPHRGLLALCMAHRAPRGATPPCRRGGRRRECRRGRSRRDAL